MIENKAKAPFGAPAIKQYFVENAKYCFILSL